MYPCPDAHPSRCVFVDVNAIAAPVEAIANYARSVQDREAEAISELTLLTMISTTAMAGQGDLWSNCSVKEPF